MANYLSKVEIGGTEALIKDSEARSAIASAKSDISINKNSIKEAQGAIASARSDISSNKNSIKEARALNKPKNYKILFCGDSYDVSNAKTLATRLANTLGCSVMDISASGRGIGSGLKYASLLSEFTSGKTEDELSQFTHIIIEGGANDFGVSSDDIDSGAKLIKIETDKFKNAKVYLAYVGSCIPPIVTDPIWTNRATYANMRATYKFWYNASIKIGAKFMSTTINWAHNPYFQSDNIHPNDRGMDCITNAIIMELLNSHYIGDDENPSVIRGTLSNITHVIITRNQFSNTLHLFIEGDVSFTSTHAAVVDIGTLVTPIIPGREYFTDCISTIKLNNGKYVAGLTRIYLHNDNTLTLQFLNINSDGSNYELYNITHINTLDTFMTIPFY